MFGTDLLNADSTRYVVVAEAALPILMVLFLGAAWGSKLKDAGENVNGRPPRYMFGLIWLSIAVAWCLALLISAFNFDSNTLIVYGTFSLVIMLLCMLWTWMYISVSKTVASYVLIMIVLFSFILCFTSSNVQSTLDSYAPVTVSILSVPLAVWSVIAAMMGLLELQK